MIEGVVVQGLRQIRDERGMVMHMLRADSPMFEKFGEVYFSLINPGAVKAWKRHKKMTQCIAVPSGRIRLVIYDDREGSPTHSRTEVIETGRDDYSLIRIPPLLWYGFMGLSDSPALVANCTDLPHSPEETEGIDPADGLIPFDWGAQSG